MKIRPLLEYQFPKIKTRHVKRLPQGYNYREEPGSDEGNLPPEPKLLTRNKNVQHLGTGVFSSTYMNKNNPHDVRKVATPMKARNLDGGYHYLKAISKSDDFANPYFPRVRDMKVYRDGKRVVYSVQMERLRPIHELSLTERMAMFRKVFKQDFANGTLIDSYEFVEAVTDAIKNGGSYDSNLNRAGALIKEVQAKHKLSLDIHSGNIMARRTPYGPQLVIVDPLS